MFVGPGGVGKSSLLHGLMNEPLPLGNSTQLAETMTVKPATQQWASAGEGPQTFWTKVTDKDEIMELVGLLQVTTTSSTSTGQSKGALSRLFKMIKASFSALKASRHRKHVHGDIEKVDMAQRIVVDEAQIRIVDEVLTQALQIAQENLYKITAPEREVLMYLWDCGGQSVFLDILPAFLTQRTMYLSLFDARRKLTDPCLIQTFQCGKVIAKEYRNTSTLELLLEWMASIHAMLGANKSKEAVTNFPRIIPVGTHGDDPGVKPRKEEIIATLNSELEHKAFAHLVKKGVIVDNTTAGGGVDEDPEFKYIRREIYELASEDLVRTPVAWVLFRRVFQKTAEESMSPIVSYDLVIAIARACSIPKDSIPSVLQFYHTLAVFFHYTEVPSLCNHVIANPQWLIDKLAKLLAPEGFESDRGSPALWTLLRERGILSQSLYTAVWKDSELQSQSLVDLLEHFLLAVPLDEDVDKSPGKKYFVSSVLHAYPGGSGLSVSSSSGSKQAAPLHLLFNTHYVPPGFFSRFIATLAKESKCEVNLSQRAYRDYITLSYGTVGNQIDEIILTKCKDSVQVEVTRRQNRPPNCAPFSSVCQVIAKVLKKCSDVVLQHWLKGMEVNSIGFFCDSCRKQENSDQDQQCFVLIPPNSTTQVILKCARHKLLHVTTQHHYWLKFAKVL